MSTQIPRDFTDPNDIVTVENYRRGEIRIGQLVLTISEARTIRGLLDAAIDEANESANSASS